MSHLLCFVSVALVHVLIALATSTQVDAKLLYWVAVPLTIHGVFLSTD